MLYISFGCAQRLDFGGKLNNSWTDLESDPPPNEALVSKWPFHRNQSPHNMKFSPKLQFGRTNQTGPFLMKKKPNSLHLLPELFGVFFPQNLANKIRISKQTNKKKTLEIVPEIAGIWILQPQRGEIFRIWILQWNDAEMRWWQEGLITWRERKKRRRGEKTACAEWEQTTDRSFRGLEKDGNLIRFIAGKFWKRLPSFNLGIQEAQVGLLIPIDTLNVLKFLKKIPYRRPFQSDGPGPKSSNSSPKIGRVCWRLSNFSPILYRPM